MKKHIRLILTTSIIVILYCLVFYMATSWYGWRRITSSYVDSVVVWWSGDDDCYYIRNYEEWEPNAPEEYTVKTSDAVLVSSNEDWMTYCKIVYSYNAWGRFLESKVSKLYFNINTGIEHCIEYYNDRF